MVGGAVLVGGVAVVAIYFTAGWVIISMLGFAGAMAIALWLGAFRSLLKRTMEGALSHALDLPVTFSNEGEGFFFGCTVRIDVGGGALVVEIQDLSFELKGATGASWLPQSAEFRAKTVNVVVANVKHLMRHRSRSREIRPRTEGKSVMRIASALGHRLAKATHIQIDHIRMTVSQQPLQLLITFPDGLRCGGRYCVSMQEQQTEEFKTLIQAREGVISPMRPPLHRPRAGSTRGENEQSAKRRVRPSQLPLQMDATAINVTLVHNDRNSGTATHRFCGFTATIGLAIGLDSWDTLAVEVFPVYIKVDLDEVASLAALLPSLEIPNFAKVDNRIKDNNRLVEVLSHFPKSVTVACEGSVIEMLTQKGQESMLVVLESVHCELEAPQTQGLSKIYTRLPRARALLKSITMTCLSNARQPLKAVSIKSLALNVQLQEDHEHLRVAADGEDHRSGLTAAVSLAVVGAAIDIDDCGDSLLAWCKVFVHIGSDKSTDLTGARESSVPEGRQCAEDTALLGSSQWGPSSITFEIEVEKTTLTMRTGSLQRQKSKLTTTSPSFTSLIASVSSIAIRGAISRPRPQQISIECSEIDVAVHAPGQDAVAHVAHGSICRLSLSSERTAGQRCRAQNDVVVVRPYMIVSVKGIEIISKLLDFFISVSKDWAELFSVRPTRHVLPKERHTLLHKVVITDVSGSVCVDGLTPIASTSIESVRLEGGSCIDAHGTIEDSQALGRIVTAEGSLSQFEMYVPNQEGKSTAEGAIPIARIAALDFVMKRMHSTEDKSSLSVDTSMPQLETRLTLQQFDRVLELGRGLEMMLNNLDLRRPSNGHYGTNINAVPVISLCLNVGVMRSIVTCPYTKTVRESTSPGDPLESCAATEYTLGVSTLRVMLQHHAKSNDVSATCGSMVGIIGGVEVVTVATVAVELHSDGLLADVQKDCSRHNDHPASERNFTFGRRSADMASKHNRDEEWWFSPVLSKSERLWHIVVSRVKLSHAHDFNMGLHVDQLQNTYHAGRKLIRSRWSELSPRAGVEGDNVLITIDDFDFIIEDDPFEARLYLGYRLRADEYDQQNARRLLLKSRIEDLRAHAASCGRDLDPEWVAEAFADLQAENAAIYCRRFRRIRPACGKSILFNVHARKLVLRFVVDDRLKGWENVKATMRMLDPKTDLPDEFVPAFTLARRVALDVERLDVGVRRFPRQPLKLRDICMTGVLVLTSSNAWNQVQQLLARTVEISNGLAKVHRDGMPLHVYHGLRMCADRIDYAWGANYDAALQQIASKLDLIVSRGVVTGPARGLAVPWFDRLRQLRHGPLEFTCSTLTLSIMAGQNPNFEDDFVELQLVNLIAAWTNSLLTFQGDANAFLYPKSRFFGSPLFAIANLQGSVRTAWTCYGGAEYVDMPHTPRLELFKSKGLDVSIAIARYNKNGICALLVHADTLLWLSRVYNDLFCVSRPRAKSGTLWQKIRPPKQNTLGQHIMTMRLDVELSKMVLMYYNDLDREYGMHIDVSHVLYQTAYRQVQVVRDAPMGRKMSRREWQYTSECCEMAAVRAMAVSRARPGAITGRYTTKQDGSGEEVQQNEVDSDTDSDETVAALESAHATSDLATLIASVKDAANEADSRYKTASCFDATLVHYSRSDIQVDLAALRRSSVTPRGQSVASISALHDVFLKDFNLVYDVFTADIIWACFNAYAEHHALRFDLSADAVRTSPFSRATGTGDDVMSNLSTRLEDSTPEKADLLGILLADSPANFLASGAVHSSDGDNGEKRQKDAFDLIFDDVIARYMTLRFSRPQILFKGPSTTIPIVQVAETMLLDIRQHALAYVQGRIKCKDSWTMTFKNVQYFSSNAKDETPTWVPYECVELQDDGCREPVPDGFRCLTPPHELRYVTVYHFIDGNITLAHDTRTKDVEVISDVRVDSKSDHYPGQDLYIYNVDSLKLSVTSREWECLQDILANLVLVTNDQLATTQHEIEAMAFRTQLTMTDNGGKDSEIATLCIFIRDLQRAVQDLKRAYDFSEQLLVTLGRREHENLALQEQRERLRHELARNKKLYFDARHDLRIRVIALNEYLLNPVHDGRTHDRKWNSRYEVEFGELQFLASDGHGGDICNCNVSALYYIWNWHNTGFGEQHLECRELVVFEPPRPQADDAASSSQAVIEPYTELHGAKGQDDCMLRVYMRDGMPVGGIPVTEHFEVNLVPLNVNLKQSFVDAVMAFAFPIEESSNITSGSIEAGDAKGDATTVTAIKSRRWGPAMGSPAPRPSNTENPITSMQSSVATGDIRVVRQRDKRSTRRRHSMSADDLQKAISLGRERQNLEPSGTGTSTSMEDVARGLRRQSSSHDVRTGEKVRGDHRRSASGGWGQLQTPDLQHTSDIVRPATQHSDSDSVDSRVPSLPRHRRGHRRSTSDAGPGTCSGPFSFHCEDDVGSKPVVERKGVITSAVETSQSFRMSAMETTKARPNFARLSRQDQDADNSTDERDIQPLIATGRSAADLTLFKGDKKSPALRRRGSVKRLINRARETSKQHTAEAQVATMRSRSQDHRTYLCFKVPSFTVRVTYRRKEGEKTTIRDLNNFAVRVPMLEYRNRTCTVKALLDQVRSDCVGHVIAAVLKTKFLGVNTAEKVESKAQVIDAITEGSVVAKEEILFGSEKAKDKFDKLSEKAKKKQEKKEERARRRTLTEQDFGGRQRFWSSSKKAK